MIGVIPALTFFRSPIGRWALTGVAVVAILGGVYLTGRNHGHDATEARWTAKLAKAEARALETERQGIAIAQSLRVQLANKQTQIVYQTRTIRERIPTYVTAEADANCPVPSGAISVLNAAATGSELPATPSGHVEEPSGVPLSTVVAIGAENLGIGQQWKAEALTWREWYKREAVAYGLRGPL